MRIVFSAEDVKAALAAKFRIAEDHIIMCDHLPSDIATSEKVAEPKRTGRLKGSTNKKKNTPPSFLTGDEVVTGGDE